MKNNLAPMWAKDDARNFVIGKCTWTRWWRQEMEGDYMDTQVWSIYELALMWAKNNAWLSSQPSQTLAFVSQIWYNMQQNMQSHINSFTVPSYPREQAKSDSGKEKLPFVQRVVHIVHSSTFSNNDSEDPVQGSLCWEQLKSHTLNILH